jgi:hypothetical protein
MVLVIEAFECDKKTNIVYSHKEEIDIPESGFISLKAQRSLAIAADRCVSIIKRNKSAAVEFAKSAEVR